jgi:hypothetical protein
VNTSCQYDRLGKLGSPQFGLIRALYHGQDCNASRSPEKHGAGVGVNRWLFSASISCLSKKLKPQLGPKMLIPVRP